MTKCDNCSWREELAVRAIEERRGFRSLIVLLFQCELDLSPTEIYEYILRFDDAMDSADDVDTLLRRYKEELSLRVAIYLQPA